MDVSEYRRLELKERQIKALLRAEERHERMLLNEVANLKYKQRNHKKRFEKIRKQLVARERGALKATSLKRHAKDNAALEKQIKNISAYKERVLRQKEKLKQQKEQLLVLNNQFKLVSEKLQKLKKQEHYLLESNANADIQEVFISSKGKEDLKLKKSVLGDEEANFVDEKSVRLEVEDQSFQRSESKESRAQLDEHSSNQRHENFYSPESLEQQDKANREDTGHATYKESLESLSGEISDLETELDGDKSYLSLSYKSESGKRFKLNIYADGTSKLRVELIAASIEEQHVLWAERAKIISELNEAGYQVSEIKILLIANMGVGNDN